MLPENIRNILLKIKRGKFPNEEEVALLNKYLDKNELKARKIYKGYYDLISTRLKEGNVRASETKIFDQVRRESGSTHGIDYIRKQVKAAEVNEIIGADADKCKEYVLRPLTKYINSKDDRDIALRAWDLAAQKLGAKDLTNIDIEKAIGKADPNHHYLNPPKNLRQLSKGDMKKKLLLRAKKQVSSVKITLEEIAALNKQTSDQNSKRNIP